MEPVFIDDVHVPAHTITVVEQYATKTQNNAEWFDRLKMDAEECILLLYDTEKYHEASQKLEHYLTKDLPDLETVVLSLLKAINTTGHAQHLLRKGVYEIIRNHIWKIRPSSINTLIEEIDLSIKLTDDINKIVDFEICSAILSLIPEEQETLQAIMQNLHPDVTNKTPAKMVSLILQTYKKMNFFWKKVWFPHVIRIEEIAEKINLEKKGVSEIKKYAYMHHHIDWRIMSTFLQKMIPIINNNHDEDLRDNAYWSSMLGKNSIKLPIFSDPTPIMTRNGYAPLLCEKGRYSAVKLLIDIASKEKQDSDIVDDVIKYLTRFQKTESSDQIKKLYMRFNALNLGAMSKQPAEHSATLSHTHILLSELSDAGQIPALKRHKVCASLDDQPYQDLFNAWKKNHYLDSICVHSYVINSDGEYEFIFNITDINGFKTLLKTRHSMNNVTIEIQEGFSEIFAKKIREISLPLNKNAYIKVYETIDKINQKGIPDEKDIFQIVHFFETVLMKDNVDLESISISVAFFTTLFGFTTNNGVMGIPHLEELNHILQKKLFISFLAQMYGKTQAEKRYKEDIEESIETKNLVIIPYTPKLPNESHQRQNVIRFYNVARTFSEHENYDLLLKSFGAILAHIHVTTNARLILYECSLVLQHILTRKEISYYFTPHKAAFYLRTLREILFKIEILDLKNLIHAILSKISLNIVHHNVKYVTDIIESYNILMPSIYTNSEIILTDCANIRRSFHKVIKLANTVLYNHVECMEIFLFQKLCNLYVLTNHLGYNWYHFDRLLPQISPPLLQNSSIKDAIATLDILMNSAIKFFILKGRHSDLLITEIAAYIDEILFTYNTHRHFLFTLGRKIFPISPILWSTKALSAFSRIIAAITNNLYAKELCDISAYVELLNEICRLKNTLKLNRFSEELHTQYNQLSEIFMQRTDEFIVSYLIPLWQMPQHMIDISKINRVISKLNLETQEDEGFLKKIEYYYQKTLACDQNNTIDLLQILRSMKDRYNTAATYKKLSPSVVKAYLINGKLFEKRWGYDTLSEILDVPKGLIIYLRLEDKKSDFLTALITPIYMGNQQKVTGFGAGGKMKMKINRHGNPNNPLMPMINTTDLTDNKFGKILEAMTFKESYYYWQRMFHPILCDGSLVTGKFRISYLNDNSVQFGCITNADGCGFINAKILGKLYHNIRKQPPHSLRCPVQTHQAVHHNKASVDKNLFQTAIDEIAVDSCKAIEEYLSTSSTDQASVRDLFSVITTGGIKNGRNFVAIPAATPETFITPLSLGNSDICFGKTPYEKLNDVILKQEHEIEHLKSVNLTKRKNARYVDSLCGFQHSFIATDGDKLIFNKGILVIIPEEEWTHDHADILFCRKDQKVNSTWYSSKKLPAHNETETLHGVLSVIQKYGPGSFVAISPDQQIDILNADFDGDGVSVNIKPKGTSAFQLMQKTHDRFTPYSTPKISKSFTSSRLPNGQYNLFKFDHIMQARTTNLLSFYSKIFDIYIALNHQYQLIVAQAIANMGILDTIIKHILIDEPLEILQKQLTEQPNILIQRILSAGVKAGSDSFKSKVDWTYLREFANILNTIYDQLDIPKDLVYFKKLSIDMHTERVDFQEIIARAKYQKQFFDSMPLHILHKTLSNIPRYKLDRLSHLLEQQRDSENFLQPFVPISSQNQKTQTIQPIFTQNFHSKIQDPLKNECILPDDTDLIRTLSWQISQKIAETAPKFIQIPNYDQEIIFPKEFNCDTIKVTSMPEMNLFESQSQSADITYCQNYISNIPSMMDIQHHTIAQNFRMPAMSAPSTPTTHLSNSENSEQNSTIKISPWDLLGAQIQHTVNIVTKKRIALIKATSFWRKLFFVK